MDAYSKLFELTGKAAIVTGASHGLGVLFAETLAAAGARVGLAARTREKLEQLAQKILAQGGAAIALPCDVRNAAQVGAMVRAAWEQFGRVDILVNNAGIAAEAGFAPERIPDENFEETIRVNLLGLWCCCREAGARMLADGRGGSIINIASIAGVATVKDFPSAYQASKAAVIGLTRNLACSWADRGVRVNAIAPGWFPSELTAPVFGIPSFVEWVKNGCPMKRIGEPKELAGPLLFLASEASSYVTGHTLVVDGGMSSSIGAVPFPEEVYRIFGEQMKPISPV